MKIARNTVAVLTLSGLLAACASAPQRETPPAAPAPEAVILPAPQASAPPTPPVTARPASLYQDASFRQFLDSIRSQAIGAGVRAETLDGILPTLSFNQRVVDLDRSQPDDSRPSSAPLLSDYLAKRLDSTRIEGGKARFASLQPVLNELQARFGVPGQVLLGIWGMETSYGGYKGDFDLFRSLASLAYDGRRRDLFTKELIAAFQVVDRGLAPRSALVGSWAGATGNPQFLPSSILASAVDGDGDGRIDIWNDDTDTLASIANYLAKAGWRRGEPWGMQVYVPSSLDRASIASTSVAPSCPRVHARHSVWKTITEWRALGLYPLGRSWPDTSLRATLIEPDGSGGRAFLAFDNYRALLAYNCSNYYALSVGLLADAISR